jgi:hypothetical protein
MKYLFTVLIIKIVTFIVSMLELEGEDNGLKGIYIFRDD